MVWDNTIKDFLDVVKSWDRAKIFEKVDEIHGLWVDLAQFAKQVIMYIDQYLLEDTDFFLKVSESFGEIMSMIRYYPYPNMVYKIVLNKLVSWNTDATVITPTKAPSKTKEVVEKKPEPKKVEEVKVSEEPKLDSNAEINDELFNKIWDQIDSKTLQHGLKNYVHIKNITDWKIELIVIDKVTEISMKKEENQKLLEQKILENTGKAYSLDIAYMDKDEYFSQMML